MHPTQVNLGKEEVAAKEQELYAEIGKLKMQLEWLKKTWPAGGLRSAAA